MTRMRHMPTPPTSTPTPPRRTFLRYGAASVGAGALRPASGSGPSPAPGRRAARTVAVLGGGVGGLTAAHELAERGFEVTVHERGALGGKARSVPVPGTGAGGRRDLPGELGHRAVFGLYRHLPDTLRRIPCPGRPDGVHGNLVAVPWQCMARAGGRPDAARPLPPLGAALLDVDALQRMLVGFVDRHLHLPPRESAYVARRMAILLTSSDDRRLGQWEYVPWADFVAVEGKSAEYRKLWGNRVRLYDALDPALASTRTCGQGLEALLYSQLPQGGDGPVAQVFDGPTSEAWFTHWERHLRGLGVRFAMGHTVDALELRDGRVSAARVRTATGTARVEADWFVVAVPTERARPLWNPRIRAADPRLAAMDGLPTNWCQGIQYYLRRPAPVIRGHVLYPDAPWCLVSVSQGQFWREDFARTWGDGQVRDCLSVDINNWDAPGLLYGKPARRCTRQEIAREVWAQMKAALEDTGRGVLPDSILHTWALSPALAWNTAAREWANTEPYMSNDVGTWDRRPEAATAIPNLFLAAEYVRTYSNVDFACMETANEAARRAVNALLEATGSRQERVPLFAGYRPPELEEAKRQDAARYRRGLPHVLDDAPPRTARV
ncbi:FAD-dependent oxidoreductase [Streptomyces sp. NPDC046261]|uniref:hydroxysqualene dehydroxylase n=1 Tax=Streptomyces sp. NPDC046261 TaxID=3157200 RepID=UPI0033D7B4F4